MQKPSFRWHPWSGLAWALAALAAGSLAVRLGQMISYPLPHYEAESCMAWSTHLLLQGLSPWSWTSYPAALNVYGIGYPLLCAPWAALFGTGLAVLRSVSVACLLVSGAMVYALGRRSGQSALICAWAGLACVAAWSVNITPTARPDTLAVLLYLAALACIERPDPWTEDLRVAAALAVAAFFVKPYALLALPLGLAALVARGRGKQALQLAAYALVFFFAAAFWVRQGHPLYFEEVFLNNLNIAGQDLAHRASQWRTLAPECGVLVVLLGLGAAQPEGFKDWLGRPWVLAFVVSILVFHFKLSLHPGATLTYFYQLCLPLLLLALMAQKPRWAWALPLGLGLCCLSLAWRLGSAPYPPLQASSAAAAGLQQALSPQGRPAGNGHAAAFLWPQGSVVCDYGQAEFAHFSEDAGGWTWVFPRGDALKARRQRFEAAWARALQSRRFGVLALGGHGGGPVEAAAAESYQPRYRAQLWSPQVPYQGFPLVLYFPRSKHA